MSLTVVTKPRVFRSYLTYDLEWVPGKFDADGFMDVRLCGVYDGNQYRCYTSVRGFLNGELTHKNRGKWFYAHAGGLADFQFLLEELFRRIGQGWKIKASTSGSSLIIVHVTRGKNSWHFVDSLWLLKEPLAKIGAWVGIDKGQSELKGEELEEWFRSAPLSELREYNELDCIILYRAIRIFEDILYDLGGQLKMTLASCAMELFRRKYLQREIATNGWVNSIARQGYFASRVEVIARHCEDAFYYDVNSSFPYAMTFPVPGELIGTSSQMPDHGIYFSDVEVEIPDCYLPPIPTRLQGRLFFPTGKWRAWLSNVDTTLLQEQGGRIVKHYESLSFEPRLDCADFARELYDLRAKSSGALQVVVKYILNSLYGKFGECEYKTSLELNPPSPRGPDEGWTMMFPGCFMVERRVPIPHMHVPIAAHITAIARRTLYHYMSFSPDLHYCDTDGFSSTAELRSYEGKLGYIKLEKRIVNGRYVSQKTYDLETVDGKHIVKAKGFRSMSHAEFQRASAYVDAIEDGTIEGLTYEERLKLAQSTEVHYTRMARSKEIARDSALRFKRSGGSEEPSLHPVEKRMKKKLRTDNLSKRCFYPDGQSRPWTIDELQDVLT